ncbi:MAG: FKBP-type peptidyl-prolyl cis-trans isomerase [Luteibaculaceae bacterium]
MKHLLVLALFLGVSFSTQAQKFKTQNDTLSYYMMASILLGLQEQGYTEMDKKFVDKAFKDFKKGLIKKEDRNDIEGYIQVFFSTLYKKRNEKTLKAGEDFLAKNAKRKEVNVLNSGVQYEVIQMGNGQLPTQGDRVKVHYHGTLIDGTVFDSSIEKGQPAVFAVNQVILGWTEILQLMPVGSKYKVFIPYQKAYGERGAGSGIPPFSALIFEIELISIERPQPRGN